MNTLIDTHCHLDAPAFDEDRDALVHAAQTLGVSQIIVPSVAVQNFDSVRRCAERYPGCLPAYGIHPLYAEQSNFEKDIAAVRRVLTEALTNAFPPVAIGEIGLDFFIPKVDRAAQERIFCAQLKLAREFDLPVLLHVRRAIDPVLKCLRQFGVTKGIAHAFNGSVQQADAFMRLGFKLGFGGAMTHTNATHLQKIARELPLEALVLETDAPDMPPAWVAKRRNSPAELGKIAEHLAEIRGSTREHIWRETTQNAQTALSLPNYQRP